MPSRFRLEEFDVADLATTRQALARQLPGGPVSQSALAAPAAVAATLEAVEKARLEGYENGYRAGWEDATHAEIEGQSRIGAEFARSLQDLGFTFHEARSHVMHALEPLLTGLVERVLPQLVSDTIGQTIIEELLPLASTAADAPIEVVVAPASRPALEHLLTSGTSLPFELVEEPTLAENQVFLRSGKTERHIDFTAAVDRIGNAINALYLTNEKAFQNG